MIRVIVADDHQLFAEGLRDALGALPDIRVVGVVGDGPSLIQRLAQQPAEILLVDLEMPGNGIDTIKELKGTPPAVIVSMYQSPESLEAARAAGAYGYVSKSLPLTELAAVIRATAAGTKLIDSDPSQLSELLEPHRSPRLDPGAAALTEREIEILSLLARGVSATDELADELYISQKTVKNHLASIFAKLSVSDRTQAAVEAIRLGFGRPQ